MGKKILLLAFLIAALFGDAHAQYSGLIVRGQIFRTAGVPCSACTININIGEANGAATTADNGTFSLVIGQPIASAYYMDISIADGPVIMHFKKRVSLNQVQAPVILSFAASPENITAGQASILNWTTSGASSVRIGEIGAVANIGSIAVSPLSNITYTLYATNSAGTVTRTVTVIVYPDALPPIISGVASSSITDKSAVITWATNEASDTQVEYGPTASYGILTSLNTTLVTSHSQQLTGLTQSTLYHYRALSRDASGNLATSNDFVFTTLATDTTPPSVSITSPASGANISGVVTITAAASDNAGVAGVQFKVNGANVGAEDTSIPYSVSWDTATFVNGSHTLTAVARDTYGNIAVSEPVIVNVSNSASRLSNGSHDYFNMLVARPDHWVSASLRNQSWLDEHYKGDTRVSGKWITYDPENDTDPNRQDAAKVTIPATGNSIPGQSQVYVPLGTEDGHRYLFTWDAYWTPSMLSANHNIQSQKTWQFSLKKKDFLFWLETKIGFKCNTSGGPRPPGCDPTTDIGAVYVRSYNRDWNGTTVWSPEVDKMLGPATSGWSNQPLGPMPASFRLKAGVWTRFWWLVEQRANDWERVSLWVADEQEGPVLVVNNSQVSLELIYNTIASWFLEYNTSTNYDGVRNTTLVSYVRNFVALIDPPDDIYSLLIPPTA